MKTTTKVNKKEDNKVNNKVYYGEYTLQHWIDLILSGNIVLPPYQRFFVWNKEQSISLVKALADNQFVPPVTIGSYVENDTKINLILDGQQRLTSILLSYFDLFPPKDQNKVSINDVYLANENDDKDEDEVDFINWDFNSLLELIKQNNLRDIEEVHRKALELGYEKLNSGIKIADLEKCFLGFSFIVPETDDSKKQQRLYSKVFRSINIEGKKLLPIESRKALYYLNKDLVGLFSPDFSEHILLNDGKMDFVRYLSLLSQYHKSDTNKLAQGYTKNMELYYENFIYSVVEGGDDKVFGDLSKTIPDLDYKARMEKLASMVKAMDLVKSYDSIIDLDLYMFGIIYITLFKNLTIDESQCADLKKEIEKKLDDIKGKNGETVKTILHVKNPSALKHLKIRISDSIDLYEKVAHE